MNSVLKWALCGAILAAAFGLTGCQSATNAAQQQQTQQAIAAAQAAIIQANAAIAAQKAVNP